MKDFAAFMAYLCAFAVLFLPTIVSDSMFFPYITGKNFWFRILVEVGAAFLLIAALYDPRYRPRFSWFVPTLGVLLVVMFFANLFGEHPQSSFWSNYERMDGYVTLVHFVLYFVLLATLLRQEKVEWFGFATTPWRIFMGTALIAAGFVCFSAFKQLSGIEETTMGWRINGTLGNAAYMAVYMFFNTFIALWFALTSKQRWIRVGMILLAALFVFLLVQTATRGTILGIAFGSLLGALYIGLMYAKNPKIRNAAFGMVAAVVLIVGLLTVYKDSAFVQNNLILQRATAINLSELSLRLDIWGVALEGVAERPLLGWGQNNFNYVFNEHYRPDFSHRAELWYDRAHNVFMDWLVTGGILGLLSYLALFGFALYYILWRSIFGENGFSIIENGLLLGIGSAYFVHNLVVFDNLVSYIFFAMLLALIHSRVATPWPVLERINMHPAVVGQIAVPMIMLVTAAAVYFVNVPSMLAANDIIDAFRAQTVPEKQAAFLRALDRGSFAYQEIVEQMTQQALAISGNASADQTAVSNFLAATEDQLLLLEEDKPTDARVHVFLMSFYRGVGQLDRAREEAQRAREDSPQKPHIVLEQGLIEYQAGDYDAMYDYMKESYDLEPRNRDAQIHLAAAALLTGKPEAEAMAVVAEGTFAQFATNNLALQAADRAQATGTVIRILEHRIELQPTNAQNYFTLAFLYHQNGARDEALAWLDKAETVVPQSAKVIDCYRANVNTGADFTQGCTP